MSALRVSPNLSISGVGSRSQPNRFIARQPILDRRQRVIGYEMLFRSGWMNSFSGDMEEATYQTIDNLLVSGDSLCERKLAFVNFTRSSLISGLATLLPRETTVIEILETVEPDEEVVSACRSLKDQGYRLALDDFVMRAGMKKLIELADYIKIDFRASGPRERLSIFKSLRGTHVELLAEKVEDVAEFNSATIEGFSHFQGYFFCRPTIIARREIPPNRTSTLQLLSALTRFPIEISEVERAIKGDPSLCYRLLRMVNSPLYAIRNRVDSIRTALLLIGEQDFRKLAVVALTGSLGNPNAHELLNLSLLRAHFCELIAPHIGQSPTEQYLIGLLSAADAILELPMDTIVNSLPLHPETRSALMGDSNAASLGLSLARHYETGDWSWSAEEARTINSDEIKLESIYAESLLWTDQFLHAPMQSMLPIQHPVFHWTCEYDR